ncbi:MAG: Uma2 family endonuclease [Thermoguttaceae bacterium]|nr:Uma2 family endonuclease [Thermoguttaceae bacterium]
MSTVLEKHQAEERLVLNGVSWSTYEALLADLEHGGIRLTYDQGRLEIVSPSGHHEWFARLIGRMIEAMTEELDIPVMSTSSWTLRLELKRRGLEADESYYVANEPKVRGREDLSLDRDPPPDLAIEVEISSPWIKKIPIYAELGVPEVWRYDGQRLRVELLQADGTYAASPTSAAFPFLPIEKLEVFLARRADTDETTWIRQFRAWVREELADQRMG